jgi:GntR family histidine utilization transcriptional repressor
LTDRLLDLDGQGPLYRQIRRAIARKITHREWRPGHRIPFENELTASLGVSRMTVNRAIDALAAEGLIVRRRKAGSFVAEQQTLDAPLTILSAEAEARAAGAEYVYERLSRTVEATPRELVETGAFPHGASLVRIRARHLADGRPMMAELRWINLDVVPAAAGEPFETIAPGAWLLDHMPWSDAEHVITATAADDEIAEQLATRPGAACLRIQRRTWSGDANVTLVQLTYPGESKRLVGRFQPMSEPQGRMDG